MDDVLTRPCKIACEILWLSEKSGLPRSGEAPFTLALIDLLSLQGRGQAVSSRISMESLIYTDLVECLLCLKDVLLGVYHKSENYYGTHLRSIYYREILLLNRYIFELVALFKDDELENTIWGAVRLTCSLKEGDDPCPAIESFPPTGGKQILDADKATYCMRTHSNPVRTDPGDLADIRAKIPDVVNFIFWVTAFGGHGDTIVSSVLLIAALQDHWRWTHSFDRQNVFVEYMIVFANEHGLEAKPSVFDGELSDFPNIDVSMNLFGVFFAPRSSCRATSSQPGLYGCFQSVTDPHNQVLIAGKLDPDSQKQPQLLGHIRALLGVRVRLVTCGGLHAAVLSYDGAVHIWGKGAHGRLGFGDFKDRDEPGKLTVYEGKSRTPLTFSHIALGFAHSVAVASSGEVYSWGSGDKGRLGLGDNANRPVPTKIKSLGEGIYGERKASQVLAGSVHTVVHTTDGELLVFGKHEYLGLGPPVTAHMSELDTLQPVLLDAFEGVPILTVSVGPGGYHTVALTLRYDVYSWGHNRVGQLGVHPAKSERIPDGAEYLSKPQKAIPEGGDWGGRPVSVAAGWGHSVVVNEHGQAFVCGRNQKGQLGVGDRILPLNERDHRHQPTFTLIDEGDIAHRRVESVVCGGEHTVFLCEDNDVLVAGSNTCGQLGMTGPGAPLEVHSPTLLTSLRDTQFEVKQAACGNEYSIFLVGSRRPPSLRRICTDVLTAAGVDVSCLGDHEEDDDDDEDDGGGGGGGDGVEEGGGGRGETDEAVGPEPQLESPSESSAPEQQGHEEEEEEEVDPGLCPAVKRMSLNSFHSPLDPDDES